MWTSPVLELPWKLLPTTRSWRKFTAILQAFLLSLTPLSAGAGVTLSGGQKQRVAIARALIKNPRILILDDSLSAVDTETEEAILQNLKGVFQGRTVILVAHRISTLRNADKIGVLDEGRIVQMGTHDELVSQPGLYQELYHNQLLEEEIASVG